MRIFKRAAMAICLLVPLTVHAQSSALDICQEIAESALNEFSIDKSSTSYLNSSHSQHCRSDGSVKERSLGLNLDVIVKKIPIKFGASSGSSRETISNFCKEYDNTTATASATDTFYSKIVTQGYNSVNQCVQIAQTGANAKHTYRNKNLIDFVIKPSRLTPATINGITVSGNITCKGIDPTNSSVGEQLLDGSTRIVLNGAHTLNFACERNSGDKKGGVVVAKTDIEPVGNYAAYIPPVLDPDCCSIPYFERLSKHINAGYNFSITFDPREGDTDCGVDWRTSWVGNIVAGQTYNTYYTPGGNNAWVTAGPLQADATCSLHSSASYAALTTHALHQMKYDPKENVINIWGGKFKFDKDGVISAMENGVVGLVVGKINNPFTP